MALEQDTLHNLLLLAPLLQDLPEAEAHAAAAFLADNGDVVTLDNGEAYLEPDQPVEYMGIILKGTIELYLVKSTDKALHLQNVLKPFEITGVLPYSRLATSTARALAIEPTEIYRLHKRHFMEMICSHHGLTERLVHTMTSRVRDVTRQDVQSEKLQALGTMAAGLAHELNNPAAAITGLAQQLGRLAAMETGTSNLPEPEFGTKSDPLVRSEAEQAIVDMLEERGLHEPYILAGTLADAGYSSGQIEKALQDQPEGQAELWLASQARQRELLGLAEAIGEAAGRISGLVGSVKEYSHMDQAQDRQDVDINRSVMNAIKLMEHRARQLGASLGNALAENLPHIQGLAGELPQVWTNLVDNALVAAGDGGKVMVRTLETANHVVVEVEDDGLGVPEDIQGRIFEPFFTTKSAGQGTGLGLDIVSRIATRHQAELQLLSEPGKTVFRIAFAKENQTEVAIPQDSNPGKA